MKYYFIINPNAGKGTYTETLEENIHKICEKREITYEIYHTTEVFDATVFVKKVLADENNLPARFYACGGDGTLGEVVCGAVGVRGASVGVIPIGTGNDFVRNFSSGELFFDIDAQIDGEEERIDLLKCNDRYAVNMVNIGFDCEVVKKKEVLNRKSFIPSELAYVGGVVMTLAKKPGVSARISCDGGEVVQKNCLLTTFANGAFCGGGFHSNPEATLDDGVIDALFVENISRRRFVSLVGSYKKGTHLVPKNEKILENKKIKQVEFKFDSTQSASIDGEIVDFDQLCIEVVPSAIDFVVPLGVARNRARKEEAEKVAL